MAGDTTLTIIGNLTSDPELRFTPSGAAVANFTVASTPRTFDRQSNEWKDGETLFMRCSIWRDAAENVAESLVRGTRVIVSGRLKSRSYETKEGEKRTVIEMEVDEVGPSLRYASAKVTKTQRGGGGGFGGSGGGQQGGGGSYGGGGGFGGGQGFGSRSRFDEPVAPEYGPSRGAASYSAGGEDRYGFGGSSSSRSGYGDRDRSFMRDRDYGESGRDYGRGGMGSGSDYGRNYGYGERDYSRGSGFADRSYEGRYERGGYGRGEYGRGAGYGRDEDRGFFERASDEVASWFGDEDAERRRRMDAQQDQMHRGRGPRGYTRSDDRIREDVNDRLTDDPHIDASDIDVSVSNGEVTLSGTVDERFAKRHAEDIAESVAGVTHVQNNIRVKARGSDSMAGGMGATQTGQSTYGSSTTGTTGSSGTMGRTGSGSSATTGSTSMTGGSGNPGAVSYGQGSGTGASGSTGTGADPTGAGSSRKTSRSA